MNNILKCGSCSRIKYNKGNVMFDCFGCAVPTIHSTYGMSKLGIVMRLTQPFARWNILSGKSIKQINPKWVKDKKGCFL